jgi:hypothetical protein
VQCPYFPLRLILSLVAGFLFVPVWLAIFNLFGLNGWGFFHSGLPILIDSAVTYWVLGYLPPFKRPKDTPSADARMSGSAVVAACQSVCRGLTIGYGLLGRSSSSL